ncbi:DUF4275 family protein [Pseudoduganella sp. LjRoot289]|uniref:DUF4275 family protein n=1 Tax=Pseudoduganella sp. LjRoot289 TaxID=3342314 RepID=UPI003ECE1112
MRTPSTVRPGVVLQEYSEREAAALAAQWLEAFGKHRDGVSAKSYLWHVLAAGCHPSVRGADALAQYRLHAAPGYIVLSNSRDHAFTTDLLPESCALQDYYVFPANMAWTMAVTHEDGWNEGPYFARHRDYAALNEANLALLRQRQQLEQARLEGWG